MPTINFPDSVIRAAREAYHGFNYEDNMEEALQAAFDEMIKCGMARHSGEASVSNTIGRLVTVIDRASYLTIRLDHQDKPNE